MDMKSILDSATDMAKNAGEAIVDAAKGAGDAIADAAQKSVDAWNDTSKGVKIGIATATAGAAVISAPFIVAAAGGMSIVSALCAIGGGALAAGGFGVAGGIIVTAGGATLAATLSGVLTSKFADDPELKALNKQYAALEELVKVKFAVLDKVTKDEVESSNYKEMSALKKATLKAQCKQAYGNYAKAAEKVADLLKAVEKDGKYDIKQVRKLSAQIEVAMDELKEVGSELERIGIA